MRPRRLPSVDELRLELATIVHAIEEAKLARLLVPHPAGQPLGALRKRESQLRRQLAEVER